MQIFDLVKILSSVAQLGAINPLEQEEKFEKFTINITSTKHKDVKVVNTLLQAALPTIKNFIRDSYSNQKTFNEYNDKVMYYAKNNKVMPLDEVKTPKLVNSVRFEDILAIVSNLDLEQME